MKQSGRGRATQANVVKIDAHKPDQSVNVPRHFNAALMGRT